MEEARELAIEHLSDMLNSEDSEERDAAYRMIKKDIDWRARVSRMKRLYYANAKERVEKYKKQLEARHS